MSAMRILDHLTRHWKNVSQPRQPTVWIDLFGKQACAPHDLPATLRRIDAFAGQENCRIALVLVRPHADRNDSRFHPRHVSLVTVDTPEKRTDLFAQQGRKLARGGGVVITGDADLEKQLLPTGVPLMRLSTFEKALALGPPPGAAQPAQSADRRPPENRGPRPSHPPRQARPHSTPPAPKNNPPQRQNAILDLIDPL